VYSLYLALLQPIHVEMDAICASQQSAAGNVGRRNDRGAWLTFVEHARGGEFHLQRTQKGLLVQIGLFRWLARGISQTAVVNARGIGSVVVGRSEL